MNYNMDELYKQEILELTDLLINDESLNNLRTLLIKNKLDLNDILLVSFVEDDQENEYGVIVDKDTNIYKYSRSTKNWALNIHSFKIKNISNEIDEIKKYPQIAIAIHMIKNKDVFI